MKNCHQELFYANMARYLYFTSIMSISDSAYAAGEFTGVTGNILSWTTTSGVGTGFTLNLSTMYDGAAPIADQTDIKIVLSADKSEVAELWDVSSGTNITFFDSTIGWVDFFEGTNYSAMSHGDATMIDDRLNTDINISGRFKQVNPVPEPATLLLLGTGLVGLAGAGRKKFYKK